MKKLTLILFISTMFANVTNNGATLTIDSDVSVYIDGNFINNGIVNNEGLLDIYGLYLGEGSLTNNGTVLFDNIGDTTLNGSTDVGDIILIVEYVIGETVLNEVQLQISDLNNSGFVNIADVVLIIQFILEQ